MAGGGEGKKMVKLLCPTISSKVVVQVVARDDQRLDLGSIARAFGLDPATLKLNGHFISRGLDLIASSVTWKSLLSFFSSKGLSTGTSASDALLVHGKPCKLAGSKRAHDSAVFEYGTPSSSGQGDTSPHRKHHLDEINLSTNKRFRDSAIDTASEEDTKVGAFSLKRKHFMEDDNSMKRIRGAHDSSVFEYGTPITSDQGYTSVHRKHHLDEINFSANKRFRDSAFDTARERDTKVGPFSLKRKHFTEDDSSTKRIRGIDSNLGMPVGCSFGTQIKENGYPGILSKMQFPCSFIGLRNV